LTVSHCSRRLHACAPRAGLDPKLPQVKPSALAASAGGLGTCDWCRGVYDRGASVRMGRGAGVKPAATTAAWRSPSGSRRLHACAPRAGLDPKLPQVKPSALAAPAAGLGTWDWRRGVHDRGASMRRGRGAGVKPAATRCKTGDHTITLSP